MLFRVVQLCFSEAFVSVFLLTVSLFRYRLTKILALFQKQSKAERLVSIHLPMYQQKGSSFRVVFWKLGTMQHWIKKKGLIHQSWLMGSAAALNRERKCEDFIWNHRKAQMKSRWRVGASENEWQNVMKNFTLNAYLDCSKKKTKGYRSKIFGAWEGTMTY